jgi:hypothetical protein
MYCHRDEGQCLTPLKIGSIVVVMIGVAVYSAASWHNSRDQEKLTKGAFSESARQSLLDGAAAE